MEKKIERLEISDNLVRFYPLGISARYDCAYCALKSNACTGMGRNGRAMLDINNLNISRMEEAGIKEYCGVLMEVRNQKKAPQR